MEISRTATGILAVVCVAAGAGATFFALQDKTPVSSSQQIEGQPEGSPSAAVAESEAVIDSNPTASPLAPVTVAADPKPTTPRQTRVAPRSDTPAPRSPEPPKAIAAPVAAPDLNASAPVEPPPVVDNHASRSVEPPGPVYEDLVVSADSVIGLQLESPVSSDRAQVEDNVVARVTRDVRVADRVAIPSGARAFGEVTVVERGGKLRERARLGVRFTSIVLADGTRLPIRTETIFREGDAPGRESAAKIGGGAIGGAIIGGILGGAKGAAIGGSIGAGAGTAAVVAGDRNHATLSAGSPLTVRLEEPVIVTVER